MALPELKSNILPDNEIITTHTQDGAEVISQLQQNPNAVESYVSTGNTIQTTHNVVPQVLTVLKENGQDITTIVEGFWDVVWSVNGQTGDVTIDAVVGNFIPNHTYRQHSIILYDGQMYRALADFTTVAEFDSEDWVAINPKSAIVFDLFQAHHHYYARQPIWQDASIYVANADFTSGDSFDPDDWTQASGAGGVANITSEDETVTVTTGEDSVDLSIQDALDPIIESLGDKVDKETGKGLSTNDYTTEEKTKLSGIETGAQKNAQNTVIDANYVHTDNNYTTAEKTNLSNIQSYVPAQASTSNQLADKAFVNSTVQTGTANFRGNWESWASVPTDASQYPVDYAGSHTPTVNDYLVVRDVSDYSGETLEGTWRFKYSGTWGTEGKAGWNPEYQVNEKPMTAAQLAALNSGITQQTWSDINATVGTNSTNIVNLDRVKVDKVEGKGLSTNDYTTTEKNKLSGIASGAEVNVQSDWNQTNTSADDYIKNKPTIPAATPKTLWYATCTTASATQTKVATTSTGDFTLTTGAQVNILMSSNNTYNGKAKLNVDNTGAKELLPYVGASTTRYFWRSNEVISAIYDGTRFVMVDSHTADVNSYGLTKLSSAVDSTSAELSATPAAVKTAYDLANSKATVTVTTTDPGEGATIGTNEIIAVTGTDFLSYFYPVGSIYMSATLSTAAQVGAALGGTWEAWGAGRVPIGVDTTQTEFNAVGKTGGEKTHTLTVNEMPSHNHRIDRGRWWSADSTIGASGSIFNQTSTTTANGETNSASSVNREAIGYKGGGQSHNNLPPYITCYMYKRVA